MSDLMGYTIINTSDVDIKKGYPLAFDKTGSHVSLTPVVLADANDDDKMPCIGLANRDMQSDGGIGQLVKDERIKHMDTTRFQNGDVLYVGVGELTSDPSALVWWQEVAIVTLFDDDEDSGEILAGVGGGEAMQRSAVTQETIEAQQEALDHISNTLIKVDDKLGVFVEDEYKYEVDWDDEHETD